MTPQEVIGGNTSQMQPECQDDVTDVHCEEMQQLVQDRRVALHQRQLLTRWSNLRPRPAEQLNVDDMKCFVIKKMFPKDRYQVESYCPPTVPHRKHLRIKSGTDGRKYVPNEGPPKFRLVKSAIVKGSSWQGYDALNRPTAPDPIPHLFTNGVEKNRSKRKEHLQQWRDQVVKKVLIKRQKYAVPIDPTAPRTVLSVEHSRHSLPSRHSFSGGRPTTSHRAPSAHYPSPNGHPTSHRTPSAASHPISVTSSEDVVIGVPSYWRNTKPKYRSHLQSWKIPKL